MKLAFLYQLPVIFGLFVISCAGCGGSSTPEATSGDELSQYLDAHPELKETKEDVAPSDPTKSN